MGAGGLQALVKGGLPIKDKKVAVAGTGPLLLAVAEYLHRRGARVELIAEQASMRRLIPFGMSLLSEPAKMLQALKLKWELRGVPYITGGWPVAAQGREKLASVTFRSAKRTWQQPCDYLACGFGLVPNIELAWLLGCAVRHGAVVVDESQETSLPGVYAAGETTGVGGLDLSLVEGQIAGYAAAGRTDEARTLHGARARALRFQQRMERAFSLREELKQLPDAASLVCRCEDVPFGKLQAHKSWRAAKLQTRCGMGPCQGRVCGPAVEFLFGWQFGSVRPPLFPTLFSHAAGQHEPPGDAGDR
jgi:NADPH-dependent 2,4-dienoyl-CoA reductase/sulfur reductase-like enzyme